MTLIELLVAITIISILAGLTLGVAAVAQETARESTTRSTILRIHTLLMDHYDTYRNRRVSLNPAVESGISSENGPLRGQLTAEARLHALREILVTEIPDRWSDVLLQPVPATPTNVLENGPLYADMNGVNNRTSLGEVFFREYLRVARSTNSNTGVANTRAQILQNQSAECLFMVVMLATGNGEAPGLFGDRMIGDTDGDGAREFLDGWGNPIRFLRWAPGANSPTQLSAASLRLIGQDAGAAVAQQAIANAVIENRDPFDLFRVQQYTTAEAGLLLDTNASNDADGAFGYHLLPLVYSLGGDEESGIFDEENLPSPSDPTNSSSGYITWIGENQTLSTTTTPVFGYRFTTPLNPYRKLTGNDTPNSLGPPIDFQVGQTLPDGDGEAATDNITNHLITARAQK